MDETEVRPGRAAAGADMRFTPGAIVADRYRIVALVGEGGMGQVYRADDLRLGQRVALKYIPANVSGDAAAVVRFYSEARIGRQVAHPNVCRVYDIVESEGARFLAMEYVDGEDLASLLRRIGRLPADKALRLTRELCAGLAAAHERGFIHRDLKPANIMIDGRGAARITDFGLAAAAHEAAGELAGTPAYMAPEQLSGGAATARSDIYALGLVLFEMFTGKRVFEFASIEAIRQQHAQTKTRASSIVRDIDPAIEHLIARCLEEDPRLRPASALEILNALPGGDPLDAAVAAGETPSPEMVEAANRVGDLPASRAWLMLASLLLGLVILTFTGERAVLTWFAPEVQSQDVLVERARSVKRALGYDDRPADWAALYTRDYQLLERAVASGGAAALGPAARWMRRFHYRDSPQVLVARNMFGRVSDTDPALSVAGMTMVSLDAEGRLRELRRISPLRSPGPPADADWASAFREAGLNPAAFRAVPPAAIPPVGAERRYAWDGTADGAAMHVDAASVGGRPVWFSVQSSLGVPGNRVPGSSGAPVVYAIVIIAGVILGRRNVVRGRADLRGAYRLAVLAGVIQFAALLWGASHSARLGEEWRIVSGFLGTSFYFAFLIWLCHLAIEPYVRRRWPHMLVSAKRLLSGRLRDPLVGADILRGALAMVVGLIAWTAAEAILARAGLYVPRDAALNWMVTSPFGTPGLLLVGLARALPISFVTLMVLVLARLVTRRDAPAFVAVWVIMALSADDMGGSFLVDTAIRALLLAPLFFVLRRYGALALMTALSVMFFLVYIPFTSDLGQWYGRYSAGVLLVIAALGVYGFHAALAGKPLLGRLLVEDEAPA